MALRDAVKEGDGKVSFTRLTGFLIIMVNLVAGLIAAGEGNGMTDIPWGWVVLAGSLYGLNVAGKVGVAVNGKKPNA